MFVAQVSGQHGLARILPVGQPGRLLLDLLVVADVDNGIVGDGELQKRFAREVRREIVRRGCPSRS